MITTSLNDPVLRLAANIVIRVMSAGNCPACRHVDAPEKFVTWSECHGCVSPKGHMCPACGFETTSDDEYYSIFPDGYPRRVAEESLELFLRWRRALPYYREPPSSLPDPWAWTH